MSKKKKAKIVAVEVFNTVDGSQSPFAFSLENGAELKEVSIADPNANGEYCVLGVLEVEIGEEEEEE